MSASFKNSIAKSLLTFFAAVALVILLFFFQFPQNLWLPLLILFGGLFVWLAFFSQFVLPVRTVADRKKVFNRLLLYVMGMHGPAVFIKNGKIQMHEGEEKLRGPGVVWLDTASGAVLRTAARFTRAIGPGVHFTKWFEHIAGAVDLHTQIQSIGPSANDNPFDEPKDASPEALAGAKKRKEETSALTRDGIEIVPNITVVFKIKAKPASGHAPGSRFGYNGDSVFNAIKAESINPNELKDTDRRRIRWNQLPAHLAADLWREYLRKFTFSNLFEERENIHYLREKKGSPCPCNLEATYQRSTKRKAVDDMLMEIRVFFDKLLRLCMGKQYIPPVPPEECECEPTLEAVNIESETVLQTITRMVKERLQHSQVAEMDNVGEYTGRMMSSPEYALLQERGIEVVAVTIRNLQFHPSVDAHLIQTWTSTWLAKAQAERDLINDLHKREEVRGKYLALYTHAKDICSPLARTLENTEDLNTKETLKILVASTRTAIHRDNRLNRRLSIESDEIGEILQWIDTVPW